MLRYTFNRAYRFNLFNFNRLLSTQSLDVSGTIPGKTCHVVDGKWRYDKESRISSPGRFYAFLQFNGRKGNNLSLSDLRRLFRLCSEPSHVKYIIQGLNIYQRKGSDFTENIANHFVESCLRCQNPNEALQVLSKYNYRIGAWLNSKSFHVLISNLNDTVDSGFVLDALKTLAKKGLVPLPETFKLLINFFNEKNDVDSVKFTIDLARSSIDDQSFVNELREKVNISGENISSDSSEDGKT